LRGLPTDLNFSVIEEIEIENSQNHGRVSRKETKHLRKNATDKIHRFCKNRWLWLTLFAREEKRIKIMGKKTGRELCCARKKDISDAKKEHIGQISISIRALSFE
jgi:hypothetical protein